jgi:hypothetical protein
MLVGQPAAEITLGPDIDTVTSATPYISSNCDLGFALKRRYLVYAYRDPETGYLSTSLCSRTTDMSDPRAAADIAYFDARAAGRPTEGWLSGVVEERHYDSSRGPDGRVREWITRPVRGIRITATSPAGEFRSTVTNADGWYQFAGLVPGEWRVRADLPAPFAPHDGMVEAPNFGPLPEVVWFRDATCAQADIDARVNGTIVGQILDDEGRPGRNFVVQMRNAAKLETDLSADEEVVADEQGRFEFRPLPAGRYVVGVDLGEPPRMTDSLDKRRYYPGVRQLATATVIRLGRGERVQLSPFQLPALPAERTVQIVLAAPNSDVADRTRVFLTGATKKLLTLVDGSIALRLTFGAAYRLFVEPPPGFTWQARQSQDQSRRGHELEIQRDDMDRTIEISIVRR